LTVLRSQWVWALASPPAGDRDLDASGRGDGVAHAGTGFTGLMQLS